MEHHFRGEFRAPTRARPCAAQGAAVCARAARRRGARRAAARVGARRIRSRHRRRLCARLGTAPRRRSRHRQIDAADPGRGRAGPRRTSRGLHFGRRGGGAGAAARRAAWPRGRASGTGRRDLARGHRGDPWRTRDPAARHHRLDPDDVDRHGRGCPRHGDAGARERAGVDPLRQALGCGRDPRRPRHERRSDRRAAGGRTYGRRGALL